MLEDKIQKPKFLPVLPSDAVFWSKEVEMTDSVDEFLLEEIGQSGRTESSERRSTTTSGLLALMIPF